MKIIGMPSQHKEFEHFQVDITKRRIKIWQDTRKAERNFLYFVFLIIILRPAINYKSLSISYQISRIITGDLK